MTQETERDQLLHDMRTQVAWSIEATMPIPLYVRIKDYIERARVGKGEVEVAGVKCHDLVHREQAKPVEVGELADVLTGVRRHSAVVDYRLIDVCQAQAILARYNVSEKGEPNDTETR